MSAADTLPLAELTAIGRCLRDSADLETVCAELAAADFYDAWHARLFTTVKALYLADRPVNEYEVVKALADAGSGAVELVATAARAAETAGTTGYYIGEVKAAGTDRRRVEALTRALAAAEQDRPEAVAAALAEVAALGTRTAQPPPELTDFLDQPDTEYDWLIPGLLERGDRVVLTGPEGHGKSTLLRQLAVQAACGLHPFGGNDFDPLRVLHIELENGERHTRREYRRLRLAASDRYTTKPGLHVAVRPAGLDLLDADQARWLADLTRTVRPDLLITGPLYKLASGDPTDEQTARTVALWLDRVRAAAGCALLLEAHTPHAGNGKHRPERPYGASLWLRWPEYGVHLSADGALRHWRGQRDERDWPAALQRGGEWPWTPATRLRDVLWPRIVDEATKMDGQLSMRAIAKLVGSSEATVRRTVAEHQAEWDRLTSSLLNGGDAP